MDLAGASGIVYPTETLSLSDPFLANIKTCVYVLTGRPASRFRLDSPFHVCLYVGQTDISFASCWAVLHSRDHRLSYYDQLAAHIWRNPELVHIPLNRLDVQRDLISSLDPICRPRDFAADPLD